MRNFLRHLTTLMLLFSITTNGVFAEVVVDGDGNRIEIGDGTTYANGHGYNPNDSSEDIRRKARERESELKKLARELKKKKDEAEDKDEIDELARQLDTLAREIAKVRADRFYEDELSEHSDNPPQHPARGEWKRRMRRQRSAELREQQRRLEEEERRRREEAARLRDYLNSLGMVDFNDIAGANDDLQDATEDQDRAMRDYIAAGCEADVSDNGCNELRIVVDEASATMEEQESKLRNLAGKVPSLLLAGGALYTIGDGLFKLHGKYKDWLAAKRNVDLCSFNCEGLEEILDDARLDLEMEQAIQDEPLYEIQDEQRASDLNRPVEATVIVPDYLKVNTEVPFSNEEALPLLFGLQSFNRTGDFKSVKVIVNGKKLDTD